MYHQDLNDDAKFIGMLLVECQAPLSNSTIGNNDAPSFKYFFCSAVTQCKAEVQPHGMADDLSRIAIT